MKNKPQKQEYLSDAELYILWILSDAKRLVGKDRIVAADLTSLGSYEMMTISLVKNLSKAFGFELKDCELVRGKFAFDGFCRQEFEKNKEFCEKMPNSSVAKALVKIHSGKFTFEDVEQANFRLKNYVEFIEFSPSIPKKSKDAISTFIAHYINDFVNEELKLGKENFYSFKKQMLLTYALLKKYIDQYGDSFIFEIAPLVTQEKGLPKERKDPYLPVHNLIAFEALDFIEIERIWITDWEVSPDEERGTYKVRATVKPKLAEFFGTFDPKLVIDFKDDSKTLSLFEPNENSRLSFDDSTSTLDFADTKILISKQVESDAHGLLRTLFKDRAKLWHNDEVLEDWMLEDDQTPKNKVYQAGKAVNRIVAGDTKIKDFLIVNTKNVHINKAYLGKIKKS